MRRNKCLDDLKMNKDIVIRRRNLFDNTKFKCDKCDGSGYEYLVIQKHRNGGGGNER